MSDGTAESVVSSDAMTTPTEPARQPLDPAAIMAAHEGFWMASGHYYCRVCHRVAGSPGERCLPFRLAEALAAEQAKVQRFAVEVLGMHQRRLDGHHCRCVMCDDCRAALAGEGAATHEVHGYCVCDPGRPARDCGVKAHRDEARAALAGGSAADDCSVPQTEVDRINREILAGSASSMRPMRDPYRAALAGEGAAEAWPTCPIDGARFVSAVYQGPTTYACGHTTPIPHEGAADQSEQEGCPETVWDGPYSFPCGQGSETGNCPWHGKFRTEGAADQPSGRL